MKIRNLLLVSVLVLTVFLVACQNVEEAVAGQAVKKAIPTCIDSDGADYKQKGNVISNGVTYVDSCGSTQIVKEYTCDNRKAKKLTTKSCRVLYGNTASCQDGACVTPATTTSSVAACTDSDSSDPARKGIVSYNGVTYVDSCVTTTLVKEYGCVNEKNDFTVLNCRSLFGTSSSCQDGVCLVCQNTTISEFVCDRVNPNKVINMTKNPCTNEFYNFTVQDCSFSGSTCQNGRCIILENVTVANSCPTGTTASVCGGSSTLLCLNTITGTFRSLNCACSGTYPTAACN